MTQNQSFIGINDISSKALPVPSFNDFISALKEKMKLVFQTRGDLDHMSLSRGLPDFAMKEIMSLKPLSVGIPTEYGGRGGLMHENIALMDAASYESLSLSLTFGINSALFLQPVGKYGNEEIKAPIFKRFLEENNMGGLMITEPDFGSDALSMQTKYIEKDGEFQIEGVKHWAGLTGSAEYWLLTARKQISTGQLQRDIDFFICDVNQQGQEIEVEELFENLGLYMIPYGRNRINVKVPAIQKLQPHTTGVMMMLDLLHRSRMQFPGMAMGFIHRMLDEAILHCKQRFVGGKSLFSYDQVQDRLSKLQSSYTICSAMCVNSSEKAGVENDLSQRGLEANSVKTFISDLMQDAAQSLVQLVGAKAYKLDHIAGRGTVDSRPFQIFEGSNDILYAQMSESVLKLMKKASESNLFQFFKGNNLTSRAADLIREPLNFRLDLQLPQRKLVELGKVIGRLISMNQVIVFADRGFRKDLVDGSITLLQHEISNILASFSFNNTEKMVDGYEENSNWLNFVKA